MAEVTRRGARKLAALALLLLVAFVSPATAGHDNPIPDGWDKILVPKGHEFSSSAYAEGVQIYRWNGTSWDFVAPDATLYGWFGNVIGTHYAGPYWESNNGSRVRGAVVDRWTPNPDAIPWLLLKAVETEGPGPYHRVTYIQRLFTTGGLAPGYAGEFVGEIAEVDYTAVYVFYRKQK
jgi:hypothetical protein